MNLKNKIHFDDFDGVRYIVVYCTLFQFYATNMQIFIQLVETHIPLLSAVVFLFSAFTQVSIPMVHLIHRLFV